MDLERLRFLDRMRARKMAGSTHAYVRGNTAKFYEWLAASKMADHLPVGPPVWICGDCHLGNLGPLADNHGRVDVQIRDLDQTVIGNPAHDLIRLGLSLATAARGSDLPGVTTARMIEEMVDGYSLALGDPSAETGDLPEPDAVRSVRRRSLGRRWRHLATERLSDIVPSFPLGRKFWALEGEEREALDALFADDAVRDLVLRLVDREPDARVRLLDAAWWVKGCSSLGKARYAALIGIGGRRRAPDAVALFDLKEAVEALAPAASGTDMPTDHAERVVTGARALAPNLGTRMLATSLLGRPMVLRELMPQDLKLEIDQFNRREAIRAARYLAFVVGKGHASQMDEAGRTIWRNLLMERRGSGIEAPSWLWSSVVDLISSHEAGYLEHCRRYALADAA